MFLLSLAWQDLRASGRSLWVFVACLTLGVTLLTATGGLYKLVSAGLLADTRALFGGDVEVESRQPLPEPVLEWMQRSGDIALVTELDSMVGTPDKGFLRVELQSVDQHYPLYGDLSLQPPVPLQAAIAMVDGLWGVAIDPVLAEQLALKVGDVVSIGQLSVRVSALVLNQPDRNLSASWGGPPVLLAPQALQATGLIQPGSRVEYEYRVRTQWPAEQWRQRFYDAFADEVWEVSTFEDRSRRIAERLGQIASGLNIIGFTTLFIGGLGVFNSIHAYLQGKRKSFAVLKALGLRDRKVASVYLLQIGMLGFGGSVLGVITGTVLALIGAQAIAAEIPLINNLTALLGPALVAIIFGLLVAYAFTLPALGKALAIQPAALFRSAGTQESALPTCWRMATVGCLGAILVLILLLLPDPVIALGFVMIIGMLLLLLELFVRLVSRSAKHFAGHEWTERYFVLRLALANLYRPGAPLRTSLLSLGSALTLLVASALVVFSLVRTINQTIPEQSPALVLYDIFPYQLVDLDKASSATLDFSKLTVAPLVRGRLVKVNGIALGQLENLDQEERREAIEDEYKLSYLADNIDNLTLVAGRWWEDGPADFSESGSDRAKPLQMAMEDREANELGVQVGDFVEFIIADQALSAEVVAIYSQKGLQTRFWFEGIFPQGALESYIHRYVGVLFSGDEGALQLQRELGLWAPNVISVRTESLLTAARELLGKASLGLAVVAGISLLASLLVLISVMVAGRARQIYEATIMHSLGVRLAVIRKALQLEYLLLAMITTLFAVVLGSAIALPFLNWRMKLPSHDLIWVAAVVAVFVSVPALTIGARYFLARLRVNPAVLLKSENQ